MQSLESEKQLHDCVKLLSAARQLPDFLIASTDAEGKIDIYSSIDRRIVTQWLATESECPTVLHVERWDNVADFLSALAAALQDRLYSLHDSSSTTRSALQSRSRRMNCLHHEIMSAWLEATSLDALSVLTDRWLEFRRENPEIGHVEGVTVDDACDDDDDDSELTWHFMQTIEQSQAFRHIYTLVINAPAGED